MPADTQLTSLDLHVTGLFCTQVTADTFYRFATDMQPVFAGVRRWHADFPVPISIDINTGMDTFSHRGEPDICSVGT